jgi:O-antigen biosynthesis protein
MTKVSFITSLYNCLPFTREMVASLTATLPRDLDWELILIDDGSTDGTRDWIATLSAPIRVVLNESNLGFAGSNNRAARLATGDFLFFLNNDLVLLPGWLEPMLAAFDRCPQPGLIGNLQLVHATGKLDHRGVKFDPLRRPFHDQAAWPWTGRAPYSRYRAVTAACCAVRRATFLEAGAFDEAFRNGYEDVDLCLRLERFGFRNYVANRSVVRHRVSSSPERFTAETANLHLFLHRWGWPQRPPTPRWLGYCYLHRYWLTPWRYNGSKLLLAFARLITNRLCDVLIKRWNIKGAVT